MIKTKETNLTMIIKKTTYTTRIRTSKLKMSWFFDVKKA